MEAVSWWEEAAEIDASNGMDTWQTDTTSQDCFDFD